MGSEEVTMATIPTEVSDPVAAAIYGHYKLVYGAEKPRGYLGASSIGKPCSRALWYGFRLSKQPSFDGRMYRLFQSGHLQEPRVVADLRAIGCTVYDLDPATGKQWSFTEPATGHHLKGNADGVVLGVPQAPKAAHILEIKTSGTKAFSELKKHGVEQAKPEHFAQMQIYMHWTIARYGEDGCRRALYVCVNKDTDEIHTERIEYSKATAQSIVDKARAIILSQEPPQRISNDASWNECKWCDYSDICHGSAVPAPTCRSCAHVTPEMDGDARWTCAKYRKDLKFETQLGGCESHRYIPAVIGFAKAVDSDGDAVVYEMDGKRLSNGPKPGFTSKEIHACQDKEFLAVNNQFINHMRQEHGAEIVG